MAEMEHRGKKAGRDQAEADRHHQRPEGEARGRSMRGAGERAKRQEAVARPGQRAEDDHGIGRMQRGQAPSARSTQAKKLSRSEPSPSPSGWRSPAGGAAGGAPSRWRSGRYLLTGR